MLNMKNYRIKTVVLDGLNAVSHRDSIKGYQKKGWTLFGVTPYAHKRKIEYRFKRPKQKTPLEHGMKEPVKTDIMEM